MGQKSSSIVKKIYCEKLMGQKPEISQSSMGKNVKLIGTSVFVGAASVVAATALMGAKLKDPTLHLISIDVTSLKLNLRVLDAELILTVHVTNPNIAAIHYSSATMYISYDGSLLGCAEFKAGSQPARSCQVLRLPARLDGVELAHHARRFFAYVSKREMQLEAKVMIEGGAKFMWWEHRFRVYVESLVTVNPVFLDVIAQEN